MDLHNISRRIEGDAEYYLNDENACVVIFYSKLRGTAQVHAVGFGGSVEATKRAVLGSRHEYEMVDVIDFSKDDMDEKRAEILEKIKEMDSNKGKK